MLTDEQNNTNSSVCSLPSGAECESCQKGAKEKQPNPNAHEHWCCGLGSPLPQDSLPAGMTSPSLVCTAGGASPSSLEGRVGFFTLQLGLPPEEQVIARSKMTLF